MNIAANWIGSDFSVGAGGRHAIDSSAARGSQVGDGCLPTDARALAEFRAEVRDRGLDTVRADCLSADQVRRMIAGEHPVRIRRERRGMTAVALASAAGMPRGYLSEIEKARNPAACPRWPKPWTVPWRI